MLVLLFKVKQKQKKHFIAQLRHIISEKLGITNEEDILKYQRSIKRALAPIWLPEEQAEAYLAPNTNYSPPGSKPTNQHLKSAAHTAVCRKWNGFLKNCFNKVSLSFTSIVAINAFVSDGLLSI